MLRDKNGGRRLDVKRRFDGLPTLRRRSPVMSITNVSQNCLREACTWLLMNWNLRLRSVLVRDRDRCDVEQGVVARGRGVKAYVVKPLLDEVTLWRGVALLVLVWVVGVARVLLAPVDARVRLGQLWGVAVVWASAVHDMGLGLGGMEQERGGDMAEIQFCT